MAWVTIPVVSLLNSSGKATPVLLLVLMTHKYPRFGPAHKQWMVMQYR